MAELGGEPEAGLRLHVPPAALRPFVGFACGYRMPPSPTSVHRGLPTRHLTLVVELAGPLRVRTAHGSLAAHGVVGGLDVAPALIDASVPQEGVQYGLTPFAARRLLGVPAGELSGTLLDLADLLGPAAVELVERMQPAGWEERFRLLDEVLLRGLATRAAGPRPEVVHAWTLLLRSGGRARVSDLSREVGWSRRHLTESFRQATGLSPKEVGRVVRFEHARRLLLCPARPSLVDVALSCGYSDQPHLAREWRALAGCSISTWLREELPFVQDATVLADGESAP